MLRRRSVQVGLVALALFLVNLAARLISDVGNIATESAQLTVAAVGVSAVGVFLVAAAAWWAVRYPFGRLLADLSVAVGVAALLSVVVGPYVAGSTPLAGGAGFFVGQLLLFAALAAVGILLGFAGVVAVGKDWKGRGLRRYEQAYRARPPRR